MGIIGIIFTVVVGIIFGARPLINHIWAKPLISLRFGVSETPNAKFLECLVFNSKPDGGARKWFRVKVLDASEIRGCYTIRASDGTEIVSQLTAMLRYGKGELLEARPLPVSKFPLTIPIASSTKIEMLDHKRSNRLMPKGNHIWKDINPPSLPDGEYIVKVKVFYQEYGQEKEGKFSASTNPLDINWVAG